MPGSRLPLCFVLTFLLAFASHGQDLKLQPPIWSSHPDIPAFEKIEAEHIAAAQQAISEMVSVVGPRTIQNTLAPFDEATRHLDIAVNFSTLVQQTHPDAAFRDRATAMTTRIADVQTSIALNPKVCIKRSRPFPCLKLNQAPVTISSASSSSFDLRVLIKMKILASASARYRRSSPKISPYSIATSPMAASQLTFRMPPSSTGFQRTTSIGMRPALMEPSISPPTIQMCSRSFSSRKAINCVAGCSRHSYQEHIQRIEMSYWT